VAGGTRKPPRRRVGFRDPGTGPLEPQRRSSLPGDTNAAFSRLDNFGGNNQTVRYSGLLRSNWLVEGAYARAINGITEIPNLNHYQYISSSAQTGGIGYVENNTGKNEQFQGSASSASG
jgi:hypothetical protein